jgi:hypothetical protein
MHGLVQRLQGGYYLVTGLWPLVHFRSFTALSGPKPDRFQTQTTGALFAAIGFALLVGEPATRGMRTLSGGTAVAAIGAELAYRRYLPRVFALDGVLQAACLAVAAMPPRSL